MKEWTRTPLFGQGVGTASTTSRTQVQRAEPDDQWLGSILDLGAFGFVALLWFFRLAQVARLARRTTPTRWLLTALCAGVAAYAFGMLTFDAFNFVQVTMLMFLLVASGR